MTQSLDVLCVLALVTLAALTWIRRRGMRSRPCLDGLVAGASPMLLLDPQNGRVVDANAAAAAFYGRSRGQLRGLRIHDLTTLGEAEVRANLDRARRGELERLPAVHRLGDGGTRSVEVITGRLRIGGRDWLQAIVLDQRGAAERRRVEADRERLLTAVEQSDEAIVITDPRGVMQYVNPTFERVTGYARAEALGRKTCLLKSGAHDPAFYTELWTTITQGRTWTGSMVNRRKDGTLYTEESSISPVRGPDGAIVNFVAVKRDITRRLAQEEQSRMAQASARARAEEAAAQAQAASAAKSDFLANISHEIRTPLNGVIGMCGLLLDTNLNAEQRRYAALAESSAETLLALLNDVLDFSKIGAGKLALERLRFDLRRLLQDFCAGMAPRSHAKGLELLCQVEPDVPAEWTGDPGRLRQVLGNLVGNAVKFTSSGQVRVDVSWDAAASGGERRLRFRVRDTGIGIPQERQGLLFEKFTQLDSSFSRRYGGTGLGLAICRDLVALMGGAIGVQSGESRGSEFWFTVAMRPAEGSTPVDALPGPGLPPAGAKVLCVDDNADSRAQLAALLRSWGLHPALAADGQSALKALADADAEGAPFQAALVDQGMPGMDGEAFGRAALARDMAPGLPILLLASPGAAGGACAWKAAGFYACLDKPIDAVELRAQLVRMLHQGLPQVEPPPEPGGPATPPTVAAQDGAPRGRVLVVEDNITNQQVVLGILKKLGQRADAVANGAEALDALRALPYDAVLMDVQMPVMDGFEATRGIRAPGSAVLDPGIPVIAMTAHALLGDRERCLEAGMDDYIAKPVSARAVAGLLGHWLKRGHARRQVVFDWDGMVARLEDKELARGVAATFLGQVPGQIAGLRELLRNGDAAGAGRLAHQIKGAAANAGADLMRGVAEAMEQAGAAGDFHALMGLLSELDDQLGRLKTAMSAAAMA